MEIVRSVEMVVSGPGDHHYHVGGGCAQDQQGHGYEPGGGGLGGQLCILQCCNPRVSL